MFPSKDLCTPWSKKSPDCVQCSSEVEAADAVDGLAPLGGEAGGVDEVVDPVGSVDEEDLKVFHLRPHVGTPRDLTLEDFFFINIRIPTGTFSFFPVFPIRIRF